MVERRAELPAIGVAVRHFARGPSRAAIARLRQAERFEEPRVEELFVALAGQDLDQRAEKGVTAVRVGVAAARLPEQRRSEHLPHVVVALRALVVFRRRIVDPRRVRQQMVQRDRALVGRYARKVPKERIFGAQLALLLERQDRGGRELLGERTHVEDGRRRHVAPGRVVGAAIALLEQDLVVAGYEHGAAETERDKAGQIGVEARDVLGGGRRGRGDPQNTPPKDRPKRQRHGGLMLRIGQITARPRSHACAELLG